ncbi:MAG: DUF4167 domain-containing protein [Pseudomonadota bacterium]
MRQNNSNYRRPRGRPGGFDRRSSSRNQVYDSNGPGVRVRGSATQIAERYQTMARDALAAGDQIKAENFRQHAEHYQRALNATDQVRRRDSSRESGNQDKREEEGSSFNYDEQGPPPAPRRRPGPRSRMKEDDNQ